MSIDEKASVEACNALIKVLKNNGLERIGYGGVTYAIIEAYEAAKATAMVPDRDEQIAALQEIIREQERKAEVAHQPDENTVEAFRNFYQESINGYGIDYGNAESIARYFRRSMMREASEDKLHELILRLARACDCSTICGFHQDEITQTTPAEAFKMGFLTAVERVRKNIERHSGISDSFIEIWLAKEFPERYQLEKVAVSKERFMEILDKPRRGSEKKDSI